MKKLSLILLLLICFIAILSADVTFWEPQFVVGSNATALIEDGGYWSSVFFQDAAATPEIINQTVSGVVYTHLFFQVMGNNGAQGQPLNSWVVSPVLGPSTGETNISLRFGVSVNAPIGNNTMQAGESVQVAWAPISAPTNFTTIYTANNTTHTGTVSLETGIIDFTTTLIPQGTEFYIRFLYQQSTPNPRRYRLALPVVTGINTATEYPEISVSPSDPWDFGTYAASNPTPSRNYIITNTGNLNLIIENIAFAGTNAADFIVYNNPTYPNTITPEGNLPITIQFIPESTTNYGDISANLVITHNALGSPTTLSLLGTYLDEGEIDPSIFWEVDFDVTKDAYALLNNGGYWHAASIPPGRAEIQLINLGDSFGAVVNWTVSLLTNTSAWVVSPLCGLSTGETEIKFVFSLELSFAVFPLNSFADGEGIDISWSSATTPNEFTPIESITHRTTPTFQEVVINTESIPAGTAFHIRFQFRAGDTRDVRYRFAYPKISAVNSNPGDQPLLTIEPFTWNFGTHILGSAAPTNIFSITNTGAGSLSVTNMSFSGANASDFSIVSMPSFPLNIPVTGYNFNINFVPSNPDDFGTKSAVLNITSNAINNDVNVLLSGIYVPSAGGDLAAISIQGPKYGAAGTVLPFIIGIENVGTSVAENYSVRLMNEHIELISVPGTTLLPGNTTEITLNWIPGITGNIQVFGEIVWGADTNYSNNQTNLYDVSVLVEGTDSFYLGDVNSETMITQAPFWFQQPSHLAQAIYLQDDITLTGEISHLQYTMNFVNVSSGKPIKIWIASVPTTFSSFASGNAWVEYNQFQLVYDGIFPVPHTEGIHDIFIPLQNTFPYNGGNLIIMTQRLMHLPNAAATNTFLATPNMTNRVLYTQSSTVEFNPENLATGIRINNLPNVRLFFNSNGMGALSGNITSDGTPLSDVNISLIGTNRTTTSNAQGNYSLTHIMPGSYSVLAFKPGYFEVTQTANISSGITTPLNFSLSVVPGISVSGTVIASDTNQPIANVTVTISGYADFPPVTTNAQGNFTVSGVFVNQSYILTMSAPNYINTTHNFETLEANLQLGNVMIYEIPYTPSNFSADIVAEAVNLTWQAPNPSRALDGYNIYRTLHSNLGNPALWTLVTDTIPNTAVSYMDYTWSPLTNYQAYTYIIRSRYSNNNLSDPIMSDYIYKMPPNTIYLGDPLSTAWNGTRPQSMNWRNTLCQSIYYEDEISLPAGTMITGIVYAFRPSNTDSPKEFQFWFANTNKTEYTSAGDWIALEEFIQCFNGYIAVQAGPERLIHVTLDKPYEYDGRNLAVMVTRTYTPSEEKWAFSSWHNTEYLGNIRSMYVNSDNQQLDLNNLPASPAPTRAAAIPNIMLVSEPAGMGSLSGVVTITGTQTALAGVEIIVNGTEISTTTNALGIYTLLSIPTGNISITATRPGYLMYNSPQLTIEEFGTTEHSFSMAVNEGENVSITGRVLAADTNQPIVSATVEVQNVSAINHVFTDSDGYFTLTDVFPNSNYTINISAVRYVSSSVFINVAEQDFDMGNIVLQELLYPPRNVVLEIINNQARVSWRPPLIPTPGDSWFSHCSDDDTYVNASVNATNPTTLEIAHRFTPEQLFHLGVAGATLNTISFVVANWPNNYPNNLSTVSVRVYTGGSGAPLNPGTMIYEQMVPIDSLQYSIVTQTFSPAPIWNDITLNEPVTIPTTQELWIVVYYGEFTGAPAALTPAENVVHNFGNIMSANGGAWTTSDYITPRRNWFLRANATITQTNALTRSETIGHTFTRSVAQHVDTELTAPFISLDNLFPVYAPVPDIVVSRNSRVFLNYNIYRTTEANLENPNNWEIIQSNFVPANPQNPSYTDNSWTTTTNHETYRYIISAVYSNDNFSEGEISNRAYKAPTGTVFIGDQLATTHIVQVPSGVHLHTLSQTVYPASQIQKNGVITDIVYNYRNSGVGNPMEFQFWMATVPTNVNTIPAWIPAEQFTQVFNGVLPVQPGERFIRVNLDTPFVYDGGNLVIMATRTFIPGISYVAGAAWQITNQVTGRSRYSSSSNSQLAPGTNWGDDGTPTPWVPNLHIVFDDSVTGNLTGVVRSATTATPIAGAQVSINGTNRVAITNAQGQYQFSYVPVGNISITASMFGYLDTEIADIEIVENQTTTRDISLNPRPVVTVSGKVISSINNEVMPSVYVSMQGYENYNTTTSAQGIFSFTGVFGNNTYTLRITNPGYKIHLDNNLVIETTDVNLGDIMLFENTPTPADIVAENLGDIAKITWLEQSNETDVWFTQSFGDTAAGGFGAGGGAAVELIAVNRFTQDQLQDLGVAGATLSKISFWPRSIIDLPSIADFTLKVYSQGSDNPLKPGDEILSQPIPSSDIVWNEWNEFDLDDNIIIPMHGEFWIGYHANIQRGQVVGIDIGPVNSGYGDVYYWGGDNPGWQSGVIRNFLIRGLATGVQPIAARRSVSRENGFIGFDIYRANVEHIENETLWVQLDSGITELEYYDDSWKIAENGEYQYIIKAVYANNNQSLPGFSNSIERDTSEYGDEILPLHTALYANFPNPFNPSTTIAFDIANDTNVKIDIFNIRGQKVKTLIDEHFANGRFNVEWNGTDDTGRNVSSGVYFYRLTTNDYSNIRKMLLMK